jgi:transcriptional regulator with XRE-family HTH domain
LEKEHPIEQFGKLLKFFRQKNGISSRQLSMNVGKTMSYVSQIERGLIKVPRYEVAVALLKCIEVPESRIKDILEQCDIKEYNMFKYEGYKEDQTEKWSIFEDEGLKQSVFKLNQAIISFSQRDYSLAKTIIPNVLRLFKNRDDFDFFSDIHKHDYSKWSNEEKNTLMKYIEDIEAKHRCF